MLQLLRCIVIGAAWLFDMQVRATHGVHQGTWYFEVNVRHLGFSGHTRVGWATRSAELQAPVSWHPAQEVQRGFHVCTKPPRSMHSLQACCCAHVVNQCW